MRQPASWNRKSGGGQKGNLTSTCEIDVPGMYASVGIVCSDSGNEERFTTHCITDYSLATTNNPNALGVGLKGGKKWRVQHKRSPG